MRVSKHFNHIKRREVNGPSAAVIRYDEGLGEEPRVVAHGRGIIAEKILELANEHDIPMEEDPGLLETLLDMDLGDSIPPQLYSVIAEILLLIEEIEGSY